MAGIVTLRMGPRSDADHSRVCFYDKVRSTSGFGVSSRVV
jgi:hypothetical protein